MPLSDALASGGDAGEDSRRLVGMQIPNVALETVLDNLQAQFGQQQQRRAASSPTIKPANYYPATWPQGTVELD